MAEVSLADGETGPTLLNDESWLVLSPCASTGIHQAPQQFGGTTAASDDDRARTFCLDAQNPELPALVDDMPLGIEGLVTVVLVGLRIQVTCPGPDTGLEMETTGHILDEQFTWTADGVAPGPVRTAVNIAKFAKDQGSVGRVVNETHPGVIVPEPAGESLDDQHGLVAFTHSEDALGSQMPVPEAGGRPRSQ